MSFGYVFREDGFNRDYAIEFDERTVFTCKKCGKIFLKNGDTDFYSTDIDKFISKHKATAMILRGAVSDKTEECFRCRKRCES